MLLLHDGSPRDLEARTELAAALPGADVGEPDDVGVFEVVLEADDREDALSRVWDAVAASGTDDIVFLDAPSCPSTGATAAPAGLTPRRLVSSLVRAKSKLATRRGR